MNERMMQFRVGVVVLFTLIIGALLVALNTPVPQWFGFGGKATYRVTVELDAAPGIGRDSPVRKNGLLAGRVADVEDRDDRVALMVDVFADRKLYPQHIAELRTTVLGDATLEFAIDEPVPEGTKPLGEGAVIEGRVVPNPLEALSSLADLDADLARTLQTLDQAGQEVETLASTINNALRDDAAPERVSRLLDNTETMVANVSGAAESVDAFFRNRELRQLPQDARATMERVRVAADEISEAADSAERNLENLENFTRPLGESGEELASALIKTLDHVGRIVGELTVLVDALNSTEGTIGRLIHDRSVYDNLNRLLVNGNHVVLRFNELTKRLQVVVEDARVFMDKIAREPGRIVGGALNRGPGIK